ncbi:hypothetical protein V1512DRAFT_266592 [Lipomyces arxii]|uniref:uncharacterized protein n=1 Tax=Lipomyces arxii TaxID=56418 RepID=UPI0034CEEDE6
MIRPTIQNLALGSHNLRQIRSDEYVKSDRAAVRADKRLERMQLALFNLIESADARDRKEPSVKERENSASVVNMLAEASLLFNYAVVWPLHNVCFLVTVRRSNEVNILKYTRKFFTNIRSFGLLYSGLVTFSFFDWLFPYLDQINPFKLTKQSRIQIARMSRFRSRCLTVGTVLATTLTVIAKIKATEIILCQRTLLLPTIFAFSVPNVKSLFSRASISAYLPRFVQNIAVILASKLLNPEKYIKYTLKTSDKFKHADSLIAFYLDLLNSTVNSMISAVVVAPLEILLSRYVVSQRFADKDDLYGIFELGNWELIVQSTALEFLGMWARTEIIYWIIKFCR